MNRVFQMTFLVTTLLMINLFSACNNKTQIDKIPVISEKPTAPTKQSITVTLKANDNLPIADRINIYHDYKKQYPADNLEEEMNLYGYTLLWGGKTDEALEIFKLLVQEYPESSNTYDSLAETYQKQGKDDLAILNYKKSLALDPDNFNAEDQIGKIKYPDKKQPTLEQRFHQKYTVEEYRSDLDQLGETLLKVHPNALKFISKPDFLNIIESKKAAITDATTYAEFAWHCSEVVANINCSHTGTGRFWQENKMLPIELRFPLQTRLIADRLFIVDALNNDNLVSKKDEIISINGQSIKSIKTEAFKHIASQGYIETSKRHEFNRFSTGMISYVLGFPNKYEVQVKDNVKPILLVKATSHKDPMNDKSKIHCGGDLCFDYLDTEKKIAVMTISSFNYYEWNNYDVFKRFVDESMADLKNNQTEELIIDVRDNGGGSPESSIYLLRHLIDESFIYTSKAEFPGKTEKSAAEYPQAPATNSFRGKLKFIIDGVGNSTTGHFMSLVKKHALGIIIGEELGSNQFCSAGRKRCRLKNTKLEYSVANNTHVSTATSLPDEVGILPDHYVTQSIEDYLDAKDVVKQYTIDLIAKDREWSPASTYHSSYFLEADHTWRKELFRIPLNFASDITFRGIEDARFPVGWEVKDSLTFWSYVFAWNIDSPKLLTEKEMSDNLVLYFNGLMRVDERGEAFLNKTSDAKFVKRSTNDKVIFYTGQINTFDGFFDKKPMTFNVTAEQQYCDDIGRAMVVFRFSPQATGSPVWEKLAKVKLPFDICSK